MEQYWKGLEKRLSFHQRQARNTRLYNYVLIALKLEFKD